MLSVGEGRVEQVNEPGAPGRVARVAWLRR